MVYLILTMAKIQAGAFAVEGAARQAARVFVQSRTEPEAEARAHRAIDIALADYDFDSGDTHVAISCPPDPTHCLTRSGAVTITVMLDVPLPLVPQVLTMDVPPSVPLQASDTQAVSRFWNGL